MGNNIENNIKKGERGYLSQHILPYVNPSTGVLPGAMRCNEGLF